MLYELVMCLFRFKLLLIINAEVAGGVYMSHLDDGLTVVGAYICPSKVILVDCFIGPVWALIS